MSEETAQKPKTTPLFVFIDNVGRTIISELVSENETHVTVRNAVAFNLIPGKEQGEVGTQYLPLYFKEFLADPSEAVEYEYPRNLMVRTNIKAIDFRLQAQYVQLFNPANLFVARGGNLPDQATPGPGTPGPGTPQSRPAQAASKVVNLHDA